jgi:hypothetical protein
VRVVVPSVVTVRVVVMVVLATHIARYVENTLRKTICDSEVVTALTTLTSHEF